MHAFKANLCLCLFLRLCICPCRNRLTEHGLNDRHNLHSKPLSSFEDTGAQLPRTCSMGDIEPLGSVTCSSGQSSGQSSNSARIKSSRDSFLRVASKELFGRNREAERGLHNKEECDGDVIPERLTLPKISRKRSEPLIRQFMTPDMTLKLPRSTSQ